MAFAESPETLERKEKRAKKSARERKKASMDLTLEVENADGKAERKRKADVLEGAEDTWSKKERKRLRKLAKEKAESATIRDPPPEGGDVLTSRKKKEKLHKLEQPVCHVPLTQVHWNNRCGHRPHNDLKHMMLTN